MIFKNRLREKAKKSKTKLFFQRCPRLKNAVKNNMESRFSSCVTKKWLERSCKWRSCMTKKHRKTKRKPMIFKNRSREKVKKSKKDSFSRGAHGSKMLWKTKRNQDFRRAWPKNNLRYHENEDHVWAKIIGKPGETLRLISFSVHKSFVLWSSSTAFAKQAVWSQIVSCHQSLSCQH